MKKANLSDFNNYKSLNKDYSLFDYIYRVTKEKEISGDFLFALFEMFWPTFFTYEDLIFLKENFSDARLENLMSQGRNIEYWINFLNVDPYFENDENWEEKSKVLSEVLVELWKAKLKMDYPNLEFVVVSLSDPECGDYGVTFYQKKHESPN